MCRFKFIPLSFCLAGLMSLASCSSDSIEEPINSGADEQFYISFQLSNLVSDQEESNSDTRAEATRAGEDKLPNEYKIRKSSIVALLFDTDATGQPNKVVGIAKGDNIKELSGSGNLQKLVIDMGTASFFEEKKKYRLFVFANLPGTLKSTLSSSYNATIATVGKYLSTMTDNEAAMTSTHLGLSTVAGLPMATEIEHAVGVMVYLREGDRFNHGTPETAYIVQANSDNPDATVDSETAATLVLTPLFARVDFVENSTYSGFSYPISYTTGEGASQTTKTEVYVDFKFAKVKNVASSVNLLPQVTKGVYGFPSGTTLTNSDDWYARIRKSTNNDTPSFYVSEYCPSWTEGVMLKYSNLTYLELEGKLSIPSGSSCTASDAVKAAITGTNHPALCYYDDGKYQSALMLWDATKTGTGWTKIEWTTKSIGTDSETGYWVTYRHAIRHGAVDQTTGAALAANKNADDGVVYPMEYGIVRNYIYQIGIKSVSALPHPFTPSTTPVESQNKDIDITVSTPKVWKGWHRTASEMQY